MAAEYSDFLDVYDGYDHFIKRVDAVRYLWLHRLGGVYADLDFAFMASVPGHPFWELVIRRLFDARRATDLLEATGLLSDN